MKSDKLSAWSIAARKRELSLFIRNGSNDRGRIQDHQDGNPQSS